MKQKIEKNLHGGLLTKPCPNRAIKTLVFREVSKVGNGTGFFVPSFLDLKRTERYIRDISRSE
jgi:hypothetical protein